MPQTHFILVHGAYHQPQHWSPLITLLHQSGHRTSTPRLPSVSATPIPDCLAADISAIKTTIVDAIANGSESVVPVFHSYGGIPGFEALATLTDEQKSRIPRVICISAFIVPKGDSLVSVQKPDSRNYVEIDVSLFFVATWKENSTSIPRVQSVSCYTHQYLTNNDIQPRAQQQPSPPQSPSSTTTSHPHLPSTPLPYFSHTSSKPSSLQRNTMAVLISP